MNFLPRSFLSKIKPLRRLHLAGTAVLAGLGYKLETRGAKDSQLGLWRLRNLKNTQKRLSKRLAIIPGFGDGPLSWIPLLTLMHPYLKQRFDEVVVFDFPGFNGELKENQALESMDHMTEVVDSVLDELKPESIIGHSLGGWLAGMYAATRGSQPLGKYAGPRSLIVICPSGVFPCDATRDEWRSRFGELLKNKDTKAYRKLLFAKEPLWFPLFSEEFADFLGDARIQKFSQSFEEHHLLKPRLKDIQARTWILWGDQDRLAPPEWISEWIRGINDGRQKAQSHIFEATGHTPQVEKTAALAMKLYQIWGLPKSSTLISTTSLLRSIANYGARYSSIRNRKF